MNIGKAAARSGLPAKTIRYYEEIGLVRPARDPNGYRAFCESDLHTLAFIGRARALGFSIQNCRSLVALWQERDRASADVKRLAREQLGLIETKISELRAMQDSLTHLIAACAGDHRPDCPILADLAGKGSDL